MKHRPLIATLTAGAAALASHPLPPFTHVLSCAAAIEIAQHEIVRRGLAKTHDVCALYAGGDRHTEGAAFAVIVRENSPAGATAARAATSGRMKLLIHEDGGTTLQPIPPRTRARA